jgi:hypothetical protein
VSYEHCDKHDQDATNGCESCIAERVGEWTIRPNIVQQGSTSAQWQVLRNGKWVADVCSYRAAVITKELWLDWLAHSGEQWSDIL